MFLVFAIFHEFSLSTVDTIKIFKDLMISVYKGQVKFEITRGEGQLCFLAVHSSKPAFIIVWGFS